MPASRPQLAESCAAVGVKLGIYYSVNANSYLNVWNNGVGNFDIILDHLSPISQLFTTPHAAWAILYFVPMLIGC